MISSARAEIITIGDEILFGQIVDTNTQWIGTQLTDIGIRPARKTSVGDNKQDILDALTQASQRVSVVIVTGGLGPTRDDITKHTFCEYFGTELEINQEALALVTEFFAKRGRAMTEMNTQQAALPKNATYIPNLWGTAPGMWFEKDGVIYVSLPGVPFEMKNLMEFEILPRLKARFSTHIIQHKQIRTIGIGESFLAEKISAWEDALPEHIKLAYLPHFGQVKLRLTGTGTDQAVLDKQLDEQVALVLPLIEEYVFGYDSDELETVIGALLMSHNATVGTAESCTGGYVANQITSIPGSSRYYEGSVVSYSNEVKMSVLGVSRETLEAYGAVSEQTAREMAEGARRVLNTTFAISTTGIAGPDGGTPEKPVGTVWIACATPEETFTQLLTLRNNRKINIELTCSYALNLLRKTILKTSLAVKG
ncbi:nicotinamide-nucleotide amidase [Dyadobacter sp. BE34]|uniref:CinA-like protein n=1 Tax=Dyadobacter fermentans TaxID=94254 RepID=A0ABU1R0H7_9BACT|nr:MULTISPECIES: competence/damage-inducible protein A [Dyadobacter]MDR6806465.1 nicotinamide-nucleotide amidase [Dyadobacter fermentans]MDR7044206.1 nicotinamide-nucleotide amidase [Dyadobacter sp. BE242]MDR7198517.1 nicotinamide-nucleotide amidase [Dyadobacter sp. BE34]MDR7216479.1 nicotinamide-nucleotide amidase [Dyadobacter sp. BE31]MDR7263995.1 nicotinamide-nucleotide amidase [Dyadobacter sp. BE32]